MKNFALTVIAMTALGAMGTTPAYASGGGGSWLCGLPIIGKLLCPPPPGGGDGGTSVPEPATLAVLGAGAGAALLARRRRTKK